MKYTQIRPRRATVVLVILFILSRIVFYAIGIRFDATPLGTFWQFLDPSLLRERLLESVWYLHAQPPIFNLFLGVVLKLAPVHYAMVFHCVYAVLGLLLAVSLFQLLQALGLKERSSFWLSVLFFISPASIVFENWLFYDYPLAACFTLLALFLYRFAKDGKVRDAALFFSLLALVVLLRSLFHIVWVFAVSGLVFLALKQYRRALVRGALVPLIIICAFYARNYIQFGSLSGSSWFGQHAARVTTAEVDESERARLVQEGKLTPMAMIPAFSDLTQYPGYLWQSVHTGIPALDNTEKQSGAPNFNHYAYIGISKLYEQDARYVFLHYPKVVLTSIGKSAYFYVHAPNEFYMLKAQNEKMGAYETLFRRVFYGEPHDYPDHATKETDPEYESKVVGSTPFVMILLLPLALIFGLRKSVGALARARSGIGAADLTVIFIVFNLIYVTLIANIFEMGENNRIRFMMDPLFLALFALMFQSAMGYVRKLERARPSVARLLRWTKKLEPGFARQFRIF